MELDSNTKYSSFWGIIVIAGTVIGGGMFALPVDLAGAWFFLGRIYFNYSLVFNDAFRVTITGGQS